MNYKFLKLEVENKIALLKINRPEAMNSLNEEVLDELELAVDFLKNSDEADAVIITGEGRAFVAGADIAAMSIMNSLKGKAFGEKGNRILRKIETLNKPVIAAVNGFALGGGCELSMACDIRIASSKAKFGQPEVGLGITPGFGGTQRLPRIVGLAKAKEIIFSGEIIRADEALRIGLVSYVTEPEELMEKAYEMAGKFVKNAQLAVKFSKEAINSGIETDIETGLGIEENLFGMCFSTSDQKEGMKAFLEKRKAEFTSK
jgi:enoyl-CoA hydratase